MHVAPIAIAALGHHSMYRYRYWLLVGREAELAGRLDALWEKYSNERAVLISEPGVAPSRERPNKE